MNKAPGNEFIKAEISKVESHVAQAKEQLTYSKESAAAVAKIQDVLTILRADIPVSNETKHTFLMNIRSLYKEYTKDALLDQYEASSFVEKIQKKSVDFQQKYLLTKASPLLSVYASPAYWKESYETLKGMLVSSSKQGAEILVLMVGSTLLQKMPGGTKLLNENKEVLTTLYTYSESKKNIDGLKEMGSLMKGLSENALQGLEKLMSKEHIKKKTKEQEKADLIMDSIVQTVSNYPSLSPKQRAQIETTIFTMLLPGLLKGVTPLKARSLERAYRIRSMKEVSGIIKDTSKLKKEYFDSMTGLPNKNFLSSPDFQKVITQMKPKIISEADITELGNISKILGVDAGDQIIRAYHRNAEKFFQKGLLTLRTGGDEFVHFSFDHKVMKEFRNSYLKEVAQILHTSPKYLLAQTQEAAKLRKVTKYFESELDALTKNKASLSIPDQYLLKTAYLKKFTKNKTLEDMVAKELIDDTKGLLQKKADTMAKDYGISSQRAFEFYETLYIASQVRAGTSKAHLANMLYSSTKIQKNIAIEQQLSTLESAITSLKGNKKSPLTSSYSTEVAPRTIKKNAKSAEKNTPIKKDTTEELSSILQKKEILVNNPNASLLQMGFSPEFGVTHLSFEIPIRIINSLKKAESSLGVSGMKLSDSMLDQVLLAIDKTASLSPKTKIRIKKSGGNFEVYLQNKGVVTAKETELMKHMIEDNFQKEFEKIKKNKTLWKEYKSIDDREFINKLNVKKTTGQLPNTDTLGNITFTQKEILPLVTKKPLKQPLTP